MYKCRLVNGFYTLSSPANGAQTGCCPIWPQWSGELYQLIIRLTRSGSRRDRPGNNIPNAALFHHMAERAHSRSLPEVLRLRFDLGKLSVFPWGSMSCTSYWTVNSQSVHARVTWPVALAYPLLVPITSVSQCCVSAGSRHSNIQSHLPFLIRS
jgi:hypothetical protein